MRRRSRLHWGAVGREAADQCGEEFTRGGACRGSPSSVESWAQRALCTPAAGARSQARCTWAWRPQYTPTHKVSRLGRPVHLRTLIATSLWMMIRHPPTGSHRFDKTAPQIEGFQGPRPPHSTPRLPVQASRRPGLLARTPHCGAKSRQENAPTCWREGRGERERAQSENLLEADVRPVCPHAHGCRVSVVPGKEASLHLLHGCRWQRLSAGSQVAEESRGLGRVLGTLRSSLTESCCDVPVGEELGARPVMMSRMSGRAGYPEENDRDVVLLSEIFSKKTSPQLSKGMSPDPGLLWSPGF